MMKEMHSWYNLLFDLKNKAIIKVADDNKKGDIDVFKLLNDLFYFLK